MKEKGNVSFSGWVIQILVKLFTAGYFHPSTSGFIWVTLSFPWIIYNILSNTIEYIDLFDLYLIYEYLRISDIQLSPLEGVHIILVLAWVPSEEDTLAVIATVKLYDVKDLKLEGNLMLNSLILQRREFTSTKIKIFH